MELNRHDEPALHPGDYCSQALQAIEVSEERRKRRKRDTGPDVIGMGVKRELLRKGAEDRPEPDRFEEWLMEQVMQADQPGAVRAMALEVLADYETARDYQSFSGWLAEGAPTRKVEDPARARRRS